MKKNLLINRRDFLKVSLVAGGGFLLSLCVPDVLLNMAGAAEYPADFNPNPFLKITSDGTITIIIHKSEMGQGVWTSLAMLIAEELEVDLNQIQIEQAPAAKAYQTSWGLQITGGSTSVRGSWKLLREAGAAARLMLLEAASKTWNVPVNTCQAARGEVRHAGSNRRLSYGALAAKAATLSVPGSIQLKFPDTFKIIGKSTPRLDTPAKVSGKAQFGIDVQVPDMLVACVLRCPVFGGKLASYDATQAKAVKQVRHVITIKNGIAVVGDHYWAARKGVEALEVKWDEGPLAELNTEKITTQFQKSAQKSGAVARYDGHIEPALQYADRHLEAVYQVPFLHHATMEPMNCTAYVQKDRCDVWAPTQSQTMAQEMAAKASGLPKEQVHIHTTLLGGGFGRRLESDFVGEAVEISKAIGKPVKVIWSREDDVQHGFYRPATYNVLQAGINKAGQLVAWKHRIVGPSIFKRVLPVMVVGGIDSQSIEGAANLPYDIPNLYVDYNMQETGVPVGFWRSVGSSQNAFITECFLDEVAAAVGKDPYEMRRHLLSKAPRHKATLELAATRAGWGTPLATGRYRGIAVHESFGSYVAQVAEISLNQAGEIRVHRVVCAIDCGMVVNPDTVKAQMQGGIVFGLTAALKGEITIDKGRVQQSNFHDYEMLRMHEMPQIEVYIVPSDEAYGGVGEPGVPPIAPAVANAVFAATGKPIRQLPIRITQDNA